MASDSPLEALSPITGFLPLPVPRRLPEYYTPWTTLANQLPQLIQCGTLRRRVEELSLLSTEHLQAEHEWQQAYSTLSYLVSAYIWAENTPEATVPEILGTPYLTICRHVEMPPVITYTALILWNCKLVSNTHEPNLSLDNLDVYRTFTGTQDERWFHMICAAMEATSGPAIGKLLKVTSHSQKDVILSALINTLELTTSTVESLTALLKEIHHRVDPTIFYRDLRPYLAGSIDDALPKGVSFDGGKSFVRLAGANAGQTGLFQFFDIALGIKHPSDFPTRMRSYMSGPHSRALAALERRRNIRSFVLEHQECGELQSAYTDCLRELEKFRSEHIRIVTRYIVLPAKAEARSAPGSTQSDQEKKELRGVGGAPLMPFLRGMRSDTQQSII